MMKNWLLQNTIYVTLHGSQAYGLNNELSDVDVKGIVIPPKEVENDLFHRFEQAENDAELEKSLEYLKNSKNPKFESTIYSLKKFMILAANVNPNIVELLWTDPSDQFIMKDPMGKLMAQRDLFLSSKAKFTFSGYAYAQLAKIERHRKWIVRGELAEPKRKDFGLPDEPPKQMMEIFGLIKSEVEKWNLSQYPLNNMERDELKADIWELIYYASKVDVNEGNWPKVYEAGVIERLAEQYNLKEEIVDILQRERLYKKEMEMYKSWLIWKKCRNPARHELEVKSGYDCYSYDTDFLTENGWKNFNEIKKDEKLATLNPHTHEIEYQNFIDKFDGLFNGNLYNLCAYHTDVLITPNHKMYIQKQERKSKKTFDWKLEECSLLPDCFNTLNKITPKQRNFKIDNSEIKSLNIDIKYENFLRLIGWYVSEGCIIKKSDKIKNKGVRLSQLKGGKTHWKISRAKGSDIYLKQNLHEYCFFRKEKNRHEMSWDIYNELIGDWFEKHCGRYSENKKLPRWVFSLSKRHMEILLDSLVSGDGYKRDFISNNGKQHHRITYYTSSKQLANDIQELAFLCGFQTDLWGPYNSMYQVYILKFSDKINNHVRNVNIKKLPVLNHRIVCFTVPNGILITRRNGRIGIHGNSKHASHLVRLMRMGLEILADHKVVVKRPDREEILAVKNGAWSYERVMEFAKDMQVKLDEAYKTTTLPKSVDYVKVNALYHRLYEGYHERIYAAC